jgi:hypothetical protein
MQRHRKVHNPINLAALTRWMLIFAFVIGSGCMYVYRTLQLHSLGDQKKTLETALIDVRAKNELARGQIAALTSPAAIDRRFKEGFLPKMHVIDEQHIVRLNPITAPFAADTVQPVSNPTR